MSNRQGTVPADANNGFLRAAAFHQQDIGHGFSWGGGLDGIVTTSRYRNLYIQQLYAELHYKCLSLHVGSKEVDSAFGLDSRLSTGDVIRSNNARPIPGIELSVPQYATIPKSKGWLQAKGNISVGRSFDNAYLSQWTNGQQVYVKHVLWHHKSFHFRVKDTKGSFPLSAEIGIQHIAQWGGTSTDPKIGEQPHSFKDFIRIFCGQKGGDNATLSDQINVLGSHHIAYDFRLSYTFKDWEIQGYHQHLCYDKSGLELYNGTDGLWGIQLSFPRHFPWIDRVVVEHFTTMNGSGPFHYIWFDHDKHPGRGGGGDNYYNNEEYVSGNTYFNQSIGSPLLPSPIYNTDGKLGFKSNRVRDWHVGISGRLSTHIAYRLLTTVMNSYGTPFEPYLHERKGVSMLAEVTYTHPRLSGWEFTGSAATDTGDVFNDKSTGFSLQVSKRGLLKKW